jgi:hypothetical protein
MLWFLFIKLCENLYSWKKNSHLIAIYVSDKLYQSQHKYETDITCVTINIWTYELL